jgi:hypothetical protein
MSVYLLFIKVRSIAPIATKFGMVVEDFPGEILDPSRPESFSK